MEASASAFVMLEVGVSDSGPTAVIRLSIQTVTAERSFPKSFRKERASAKISAGFEELPRAQREACFGNHLRNYFRVQIFLGQAPKKTLIWACHVLYSSTVARIATPA